MNPTLPIFRGDGILLRPFRPDDAAAFTGAALASVESVGKWLPWCHRGFSASDASQWIDTCMRNLAAQAAFSMGIFSEDGSELLGGIGITQVNREHNFAQVGYWVSQQYQGRGIAPRAVRAMAAFGFGALGLTRLEILVAIGNDPSRRAAEKSGAMFEGVLKNRLVIRGTPHDAAMYSLTPGGAERR